LLLLVSRWTLLLLPPLSPLRLSWHLSLHASATHGMLTLSSGCAFIFLQTCAWQALEGRALKLVPWGADARQVMESGLDPSRESHRWIQTLKMEVPDVDVSHPNAPSLSTDESNVSKHLSSVVRVAKFVSSGVFRDVKQLKSRLRVVHSAYDGEQLHRKRMEALRQVRPLLARILQRLCRALNWMRGTVDKANCNVGSLDVIDPQILFLAIWVWGFKRVKAQMWVD
jgi:hypothetical protein